MKVPHKTILGRFASQDAYWCTYCEKIHYRYGKKGRKHISWKGDPPFQKELDAWKEDRHTQSFGNKFGGSVYLSDAEKRHRLNVVNDGENELTVLLARFNEIKRHVAVALSEHCITIRTQLSFGVFYELLRPYIIKTKSAVELCGWEDNMPMFKVSFTGNWKTDLYYLMKCLRGEMLYDYGLHE